MTTDQELNNRLVEKWRNTFDARVFGAVENPFHLAGVLNQYVFDNHERPYLDFSAAHATMPLGQGYPLVGEGITELVKFFYQTAPYGQHIHGVQMEFIEAISGYFHPGDKFLFTTSETEALHTAVEMVRQQSERTAPRVLAINRTSLPIGLNHNVALPWKTMSASAVLNRIEEDDLDGFLVSPFNPDTYEVIAADVLQAVVEQAELRSLPIIWDETVAGMGWMSGMFNIPDYAEYTVLGGALGGGLPLAAVVGRNLVKVLEHEVSVNRLSGSSLAFAAGLHTYRGVMHLKRLKGQSDLVAALDDELVKLQRQFPEVVKGLTGESLLRGVVFKDPDFTRQFVQQCREDGILLMSPPSGGRVVRIAAPMVCSLPDIEEFAGVMLAAIMKVRASDDGREGERDRNGVAG